MVLSMGRIQGGHLWEPLSAWSLGVTPDGQRGLQPQPGGNCKPGSGGRQASKQDRVTPGCANPRWIAFLGGAEALIPTAARHRSGC